MYTGGTTLLAASYAPADKARTQGANDLAVFATMAVSSLASGALVSLAGWERMNLAALPALAVVVVAVVWLVRVRGGGRLGSDPVFATVTTLQSVRHGSDRHDVGKALARRPQGLTP